MELQHVDETINQFLFARGGKCIFHHFFHSAQGCFLLSGAASTHSATQEASSTAPPSPPLFPPSSLSLLLTRPWWKLLTGQGSMEQCGEVIVHTALPLLFLLCVSLSLSTVILSTQPNIAGVESLPSVFKPPQPQDNDFSWYTRGENA